MKTVISILFTFFWVMSLLQAKNIDYGREAFTLTIQNDRIQVIAPKRKGARVAIVIHNNTKTPIVGRIEEEKGEIIDLMSVPPGQNRSIEFEYLSEKPLLFFPLSPPFQEVVLAVGMPPYELPEKSDR